MSNYGPSQFDKNSLRDQLKEGTREVHGVADKLFTDAFLGSKHINPINVKTYRIFLSQLYYVYRSLERALLDNADHPIVGPTYFPQELNRYDQLVADLQYYYGDDWINEIAEMPSTRVYADRLSKLAGEKPMLLISHAYVRYQGDISGGQQIMKILQRLFHLNKLDNQGIRFFEFTNISNIKQFKDFYSGRMNELELTDADICDLVKEAQISFQMTIDIFEASLEEAKRQGVLADEPPTSEVNQAVKKIYGKGCPLMNRSSDDKITPRCPITAICTSNTFTYGVLALLVGITTILVGPWSRSSTTV